MNKFEKCMEFILEMEGGYDNDPHDPGGETKYGICKRNYPDLDIGSITKEHAESLYYKDYWRPIKAESIPWPLCLIYFDAAVNQGQGIAPRMLQAALGIPIDGVIGPHTINAANKSNQDVVIRFLTLRAQRYIGTRGFERYGAGWLNRLFKVAMQSNQASP